MPKKLMPFLLMALIILVPVSAGEESGAEGFFYRGPGGQAGEDQPPSRFVVHLPRVELKVGLKLRTVEVKSGRFALSEGAGFVVKQVKTNIYHIKRRDWTEPFWTVNTMRRELHSVTRGTFGEEGGREELLRTQVETRGSRNLPTEFTLRFRSSRLQYIPGTGAIRLTCENGVVSYGEELEMINVKPQIFQLRGKSWRDAHWEFHTYEKKLYVVTGSQFGTIGGKASPLMYKFEVEY